MKPSSSKTLLHVKAADLVTEIKVLDASLKKVGQGFGELKKALPEGFYKVRFRVGASIHDELVDVTGSDTVIVPGPKDLLRCAPPLADTRTYIQAQGRMAATLSALEPQSFGSGSGLFIFVREQDEDSPQPMSFATVSLHTLDGERLLTLPSMKPDKKPMATGGRLALDPGTYRLRISQAQLGDYELFVTTVSGWETRVFFQMETFEFPKVDTTRCPSIRHAAVQMARLGQPFSVTDAQARLTELAHIALTRNRAKLGNHLIELYLSGRAEDPMFGLYACQVAGQGRKNDPGKIKQVLDRLTEQLGASFPDLVALRLSLANNAGKDLETLEAPPLFNLSWQKIITEAKKGTLVLPEDSVVAEIGENIAPSRPFLIHRAASNRKMYRSMSFSATVKNDTSQPKLEEMLGTILAAGTSQRQKVAQRLVTEEDLSMLDTQILATEMPLLEQTNVDNLGMAKQMIRQLQAPPASIAKSINRIAKHIDLLSNKKKK